MRAATEAEDSQAGLTSPVTCLHPYKHTFACTALEHAAAGHRMR
jgi:hypothetical protein